MQVSCNTIKRLFPTPRRRFTSEWIARTWEGAYQIVNSYSGSYIWTDGTNIYYSNKTLQGVLTESGWAVKTWNGLSQFFGSYIWTDGTNIYYSNTENQFVLNGDTWVTKDWNVTLQYGSQVWTDGTNIYYSYAKNHYKLVNGVWETKEWQGTTDFTGGYVWTDGTNIYYSYASNKQFVLKGDTWETNTWNLNGLALYGDRVWTDGKNIYHSLNSNNYMMNNGSWEKITWGGLTNISGSNIWTDGRGVYYSGGTTQYSLEALPVQYYSKQNGEWNGKSIKAILRKNGGEWGEISTADLNDGKRYILGGLDES